MGYSAQRQNILCCLGALEHVLRHEAFRYRRRQAVHAALAHYTAAAPPDRSRMSRPRSNAALRARASPGN